MIEYILYSIGILLLYIFCGIGLTFLLCPKNLERYSLFFSPFVGLVYLSYSGLFFADFSTLGSNSYALWLLFPPLVLLIISGVIKKDRIGELFSPFQKDNLSLIGICIIIFLGISTPFLFKLNTLTTMSLGNNDIAQYAAVSKFLTQSSFIQTQMHVYPYFVKVSQTGAHFSAYFSTAIPSSLLSIDPYKIQNIVLNLFYVFTLPIVFILGTEIFEFKKSVALIITLLTGLSFHLIYINYNGFLGQVLGLGIFLSLFIITMYSFLNCNTFSSFLPYIPLTTLFTLGLFIGYSPLLMLYYIPILMFLILVSVSSKSGSYLLTASLYLLVTLFLTFLISPFTFIEVLSDLWIYNTILGWEMQVLSPASAFGLVGDNLVLAGHIIGMQLNPIADGAISLLIVLIVLLSLIHLYKVKRRLFYLSISYISFFLVLYSYLEFQEISSPGITGESYKAYKLFTYFIPIMLLSGLSYFRNFEILSVKKISKSHIIGIIFLFLLVLGNIWSASVIIMGNNEKGITINKNIIDLQKITQMENVTSINVDIPPFWDQMWAYYFLFMDKTLYLKYDSYYQASPSSGEWTLEPTAPSDIVTVLNTEPPSIIKINNGYFLTKNNLEGENNLNVVLAKGWYGPESNTKGIVWRWTGANNEDPAINLYAQNETRQVDFILNFLATDANNNFSVFLDGKKTADCNESDVNNINSCVFSALSLSKGEHELVFKSKLPARIYGRGDPRMLSYAFTNIRIVVNK